MNDKNRSLYSLFHRNSNDSFVNGLRQHFINKMINNLKMNTVTKDEITSMESELTKSPALLTDMPLLAALFSIVVAVTSNLYVPYINSLLPPLIKEEKQGYYSSDIFQVLDTCVHQLEELQNITYYILAFVAVALIVKIVLNMKKKYRLEALHEYERQLIKESQITKRKKSLSDLGDKD